MQLIRVGVEALKRDRLEEGPEGGSHAGSKKGDSCNLHDNKKDTKRNR